MHIPLKAKIALPLLIVLLNVVVIVASASLVMARFASINLSENFAEEITQAFTTADAVALIAAATCCCRYSIKGSRYRWICCLR